MPWLNGGGWTTEIIAWPTPDRWDWRLSVADIQEDGPFSVFENTDRTIALLEGNGFALTMDHGHIESVADRYSPYSFPGDEDCSCRLLDGPVQDLNLMARRGTVDHRLVFIEISGSVELSSMVNGEVEIAVVVAGQMSLGDHPLSRLDAIRPTQTGRQIDVTSPETAVLAVISIPS